MRATLKMFAVVALAGAGLTAAIVTNGASDPAISLHVNRAERTLTVSQNGVETETFKIAVGSDSHPTPPGQFFIEKIIWNPGWVPPNAEWSNEEEPKEPGDPENPMQAVKIYFNPPDYFIHGTNAPHSIGEAASHGCIRMEVNDALMLARMIQDLSGSGHDDDWYADVVGDPTRTTTVDLTTPVAILIE